MRIKGSEFFSNDIRFDRVMAAKGRIGSADKNWIDLPIIQCLQCRLQVLTDFASEARCTFC